MLEGNNANYIAAVYMDEELAGLCFCDVTTGKTHATAFSGAERINHLLNELGRFSPVYRPCFPLRHHADRRAARPAGPRARRRFSRFSDRAAAPARAQPAPPRRPQHRTWRSAFQRRAHRRHDAHSPQRLQRPLPPRGRQQERQVKYHV
ncbi:MAG: hypothetical protein IJ354_08045, partial [Clostridia bacterium]|nr:hypothetical protein [Clostridia bacterium]